jgi:acyl-CoA reductase-like NAD-dependent aldehyde dehydrogenase
MDQTDLHAHPTAPSLVTAFESLRAGYAREPMPELKRRLGWLASLHALVRDNAERFADAVNRDFGHRSADETRLLEIFPTLEGIRHNRKHLPTWMQHEARAVSAFFRPGRAKLIPQPLGVVGVIVPWNYPIYLSVGPLAAALAAGNRVMLKMSEFTPATTELLAGLLAERFRPDEVAVLGGDAEVGKAFAGLPFDHLMFTGSTAIGRSVMQSAAEHLTPVTLELGGKSPAIVGPGYPVDKAAERIMAGKLLNAGQTCIAPDYALVPASQVEGFVAAAKKYVAEAYPSILRTPDYTSMATHRQFHRMVDYLNEARAKGAKVVPLAAGRAKEPDAKTRRVPPVIVLDAPADLHLMRHEIFGPILPVVPYMGIDEAIGYVNARPRPLALYYFDHDQARIDRVLARTVSGGVTVNDTLLHIAQDDLPFGGVGPSGMGHYHGREGFATFSKMKPVFYQSRINGMGLFKPPYGKAFRSLLGVLIRR